MPVDMKEFWDARAREDAFYFVDNTGVYKQADLDRFWASGERSLDLMLEMLDGRIAPGDRIVEIGCGLGRITRVLAGRGASVRAFDVSEEMLAKAHEFNPHLDNVDWILGDGRTLAGIADASADVVHSFVVFQHIPDPQITLGYVREIGRVLVPGGWAFFQVSNLPAIHRRRPLRWRIWFWINARVGRAPRGQSNPAWLGSAVDLGELREVAAAAGMTIEKVVGEGTQFCFVKLRRIAASDDDPMHPGEPGG